MSVNWIILSIVAAIVIAFIVFTIVMNQRDKKEYSDYLDKESKNTNEVDVDKDQY